MHKEILIPTISAITTFLINFSNEKNCCDQWHSPITDKILHISFFSCEPGTKTRTGVTLPDLIAGLRVLQDTWSSINRPGHSISYQLSLITYRRVRMLLGRRWQGPCRCRLRAIYWTEIRIIIEIYRRNLPANGTPTIQQ